MNDREEIEQMARCMANCENTCDECFEQLESVTKKKIKDREQHCHVYMFAKRAVEQRYRKILEDCIVLTKEQIEHPTDDKVIEFFVKHNEKVRKITVEEILKKIDKELYDISRLYLECVAKNSKDDDAINNYGVMTLAHNIVVNVAKEYGVEIKD